MKMYNVHSTKTRQILAIMPMETLVLVLDLADSAIARIARDIEKKGECELNFNGRPKVGFGNAVTISLGSDF